MPCILYLHEKACKNVKNHEFQAIPEHEKRVVIPNLKHISTQHHKNETCFPGLSQKTYTKTAVQHLGPKQEVHRTYHITETS